MFHNKLVRPEEKSASALSDKINKTPKRNLWQNKQNTPQSQNLTSSSLSLCLMGTAGGQSQTEILSISIGRVFNKWWLQRQSRWYPFGSFSDDPIAPSWIFAKISSHPALALLCLASVQISFIFWWQQREDSAADEKIATSCVWGLCAAAQVRYKKARNSTDGGNFFHFCNLNG